MAETSKAQLRHARALAATIKSDLRVEETR